MKGIGLGKKEKGVKLKGMRAHGLVIVNEALVWFTVEGKEEMEREKRVLGSVAMEKLH